MYTPDNNNNNNNKDGKWKALICYGLYPEKAKILGLAHVLSALYKNVHINILFTDRDRKIPINSYL